MENVHSRLAAAADTWDVRISNVVETTTSLIAYGTRFHRAVVLKLVRLRGDEWEGGAVAAAFRGQGVVPVIARAPGAVLMQQLQPGRPLTEVAQDDDVYACGAIADVIRQMQGAQPAQVAAVNAEQWGKGFDRYLTSGDTQLDAQLVRDARDCFHHLCETQRATRLLHGDLQHYNILYDEQRGWTAIDPKGVVAELEFEFGPALRNPHGMPQLYSAEWIVEQRLRLMSAGMGIDVTRIKRWAFAQAVLSAIWTIEDADEIQQDDPALLLARALQAA